MDRCEHAHSGPIYTNVHRFGDRSGSRIHSELYVLAWCQSHGVEYLGSLIDTHPQRHCESVDDYVSCTKLLKLPRNVSQEYVEGQKRDNGAKYLESTEPFIVYDQSSRINELITPTIREQWIQRWWHDKKEKKGAISIVVHMRRGDVWPNSHPGRYLYNSYYMDILEFIVSRISDNYKITICTDGYSNASSATLAGKHAHETFDVFIDRFSENNVELKINDSNESDWRRMIEADILIMSKSSFSYPPAIFNKGIVIYHPFWHGKLDGWLDSQDPDFSDQLDAQLAHLRKPTG